MAASVGIHIAALAKLERDVQMNITVEEAKKHASKDGEYQFIEILGKGAFGTVFLANDRASQFKVAVKLCKTEVGILQMITTGLTSKDLLNNAVKEAECLSKLKHPHVLQLIDVYIFKTASGGIGLAIVTEYCPNGNLETYLKKYRPAAEKRLKWCYQLTKAIAYIHSQEVTHRDIKPENILIDKDGDLVVGDVGVAKAAWDVASKVYSIKSSDCSFETYMNTVAGSPAYMAPEVRDGHYTKSSDIFSMGLVFVMIVESPASLIPYAKWKSVRCVLGELLYACKETRNLFATDLLDIPFEHASKGEKKLFDQMLSYDYRKRPNAADVASEIETIYKLRGIITAALIAALTENRPQTPGRRPQPKPIKKKSCPC